MTDTKIVIPGKDDQVCFQMRQTSGEIGDDHAKLLGTTFATLIARDAHPAFVKSVFDQLSKHYIRETFNKLLPQSKVNYINQSCPESESTN